MGRSCRTTPCPKCPFARATSKEYLDTMGEDKGVRFIGQAIGPFMLPCHMDARFSNWRSDITSCNQCAGAAIYRSNIKAKVPPSLLRLPEDHSTVFSSPEEMLAHYKGVSLETAAEELRKTTPEQLLRIEWELATVRVNP